VAIDVDQNTTMPSGYEVYIDGGRTATGVDAVEWAKRIDGYGVPVILPTSKAGDGSQNGYDLPVIKAIKDAVSAEVVASGSAGKIGALLRGGSGRSYHFASRIHLPFWYYRNKSIKGLPSQPGRCCSVSLRSVAALFLTTLTEIFTSNVTSGIITRCVFTVLGVEEDENSRYPGTWFASTDRETGR
jgi:hypothetical protein